MDGVKRATSSDFQQLQKALDGNIASVHKFLLSECNGGIWLMEKKLLSTDSIIQTTCNNSSSKLWNSDIIPLAIDGQGGDTLLVYLSDSTAVYEWDEDSGLSDSPVSKSLLKFLEDYRNKMLNGHFEFVEDVGIIEHVNSSPQKGHRK